MLIAFGNHNSVKYVDLSVIHEEGLKKECYEERPDAKYEECAVDPSRSFVDVKDGQESDDGEVGGQEQQHQDASRKQSKRYQPCSG